MNNEKSYSLAARGVLMGFFRTNAEVYRAQEVLTDFGYPKEMAIIRDVDDKSSGFARRFSFAPLIKGGFLWKGPMIGVAGILVALGVATYLISISQHTPDELIILTVVWSVFTFVSLAVCGALGYVVAMTLSSPLSEEESNRYKSMMEKGRVLITVAPRNSADACDIEREWKEIGGEVINQN